MFRALVAFVTLLAGHWSLALGQTETHPAENAALKYWQAFAQLPKLLEAEVDKLNSDCLTMPLDGQARELVAKADYALMMLHHAAALERCDWGVGYEAGIGTRLPQAQASRELSALACLRARIRLEEGHNAEALDDLLDCLTLSRHISVGGGNIMVLVGYSIEARASQVLAAALPKLSPDLLKVLAGRLNRLPEGGSPAKGLQCERLILEISVTGPLQRAKDKASILAVLGQIFLEEGKVENARKKADKAFEEMGGNAEGVVQKAAQVAEAYGRLARPLGQPLKECLQAWEHEHELQAGNPLFKQFVTAIPIMRWRQLQAETRRALLSAAVAVQMEGPASLKNRVDPIQGEPFDYVPFAGGFELRTKHGLDDELRTKLKLDEKSAAPISLVVGQKGK